MLATVLVIQYGRDLYFCRRKCFAYAPTTHETSVDRFRQFPTRDNKTHTLH